jgi:hypothetical protein
MFHFFYRDEGKRMCKSCKLNWEEEMFLRTLILTPYWQLLRELARKSIFIGKITTHDDNDSDKDMHPICSVQWQQFRLRCSMHSWLRNVFSLEHVSPTPTTEDSSATSLFVILNAVNLLVNSAGAHNSRISVRALIRKQSRVHPEKW